MGSDPRQDPIENGPASGLVLSLAVDDPALGQIVRRKFHADFVARDDADEILAHFAGHVRQHFRSSLQFNPETGVGQGLSYGSGYFKRFVFGHARSTGKENLGDDVFPFPAQILTPKRGGSPVVAAGIVVKKRGKRRPLLCRCTGWFAPFPSPAWLTRPACHRLLGCSAVRGAWSVGLIVGDLMW